MEQLINNLIENGYLKTPEIINAFRKIDRVDFIPEELKSEATANTPLPIGYGQTISQPLTVAFMLELLQPKSGHKILDVGSGSGWQSSLLAYITGDEGRVIAIERISELSEFGKNNSKKYNFKNLEFVVGDGSKGYKKEAPYDRIIVTAGAPRIPKSLLEQLKDPGKLLIPVGGRGLQELKLVEKKEGEFSTKNLGGCVFVPLIGEEGW